MDTTTFRVPSLVGGIPTKADFVPSVIFAVAYGILLIPVGFRLSRSKSRVFTLLIGTLTFSIERIVVFSVRASQAHFSSEPSKGRLIYQQVSFALGFISFATDSVALLRACLVNATLPNEALGHKDHPRQRFWFRRFADFYGLAYLGASVPGIISGSRYSAATHNQTKADEVFRLRYVSAGVATFLLLFSCIVMWKASRAVHRIEKRPLHFLLALTGVAVVVPLYRMGIMHNTTPYLTPIPGTTNYPAGSLTSHSEKALFYIFHALPEYIASSLLLSVNLRKLFNTGPFGDWRGSDARGLPRTRKDGIVVEATPGTHVDP